jgi:DNA-binding transcriptional regulator GbsR (MarR family)
MGTRWGINRTVAQIHALLYLADEPLDAETIATTLGLARSNVSTSLRELQAWRVARVVHELGSRRDRYETEHDVWTLFRTILEQRKRREIDPTLAVLRECVTEAEETADATHVRERLGEMLDFFERTTAWYDAIARLPRSAAIRLVAMGDRLPKLLERKR